MSRRPSSATALLSIILTLVVLFPKLAAAFDLKCSHGYVTNPWSTRIGDQSRDCKSFLPTVHSTNASQFYMCAKSSGGEIGLFNAYTGAQFSGVDFVDVPTCDQSLKHAQMGANLVCAPVNKSWVSVDLDQNKIGANGSASETACEEKVTAYISSPAASLMTGSVFNQWKTSISAVGYTDKVCEDETAFRHLLGQTPDGEALTSACRPDTLYSWGDQTKLDWYKANLGTGAWVGAIPRALFTTPSPSGSFGYGPIQLRFKVKPNVAFKVSRASKHLDCAAVPAAEASTTVYVLSWGHPETANGTDYVICSSDVIESWSFGTPEAYDEVARELNWVATHDDGDYNLYVWFKGAWVGTKNDQAIDIRSFSEATIESQLSGWAQGVAASNGEVFYNAGVAPDRARHFRTSHPTYANPD